jgi:VanZ family protein
MGTAVKLRVRAALLFAWIGIILFLTAYPSLPMPKIKSFPIDKVYHFILFFIFGLFARPVLRPVKYFGFGVGLILIAEFQQLFIPGRDFEIMDMVAGCVGLIVFFIISLPKRSLRNDLSKA